MVLREVVRREYTPRGDHALANSCRDGSAPNRLGADVANRLERAGEVALNQLRSACERRTVGVEQRVEFAAPARAAMREVLLERPGEIGTYRETVAGEPDGRLEHLCSRPAAEPSVGLEKSRHDGRRRDAEPAAHHRPDAARPAKMRRVETRGHPCVELDHEGPVAIRCVNEEPTVAADAAVRWIDDAERKGRRDDGVDRRAAHAKQIPSDVGRDLLGGHQQPAGVTRLVSGPGAQLNR